MPGNVKFEGSGLKPQITKRAWVGGKRLLEVIRVDIKPRERTRAVAGVLLLRVHWVSIKVRLRPYYLIYMNITVNMVT